MKKNLALRKKLISTAILSVIVCTQLAAAAAETKADFKTLYNEKHYDELCKRFEVHQSESWRNADSAYYYAIALLALGKTDKGLAVCKGIQKRYPATDAATLAKSAMVLWTTNSASNNYSTASRSRGNSPAVARSPDLSASIARSKQMIQDQVAQIRAKQGLSVVSKDESTVVTPEMGVVGLKFCICHGDKPSIQRIFPNTPAQQADLREGDIIETVGRTTAQGLSKIELFNLICGPPNSILTMTISRDGTSMQKRMKRVFLEQIKVDSPQAYREYQLAR